MSEAEFGVLLDQGMQALAARASADKRQARIVDLAAWRAAGILKRAKRDQSAIVDGRLGGSEFARRAGLLWRSARI
jgi:phytoene synthase